MSDENNVPDWVKDLLSEEDKFWKFTYSGFSFDEKVKHWSGTLFRQMRWQVESGLDPYAIYSLEWYNNVKKEERHFDEIMDVVFTKYWEDLWSKEEYLKRITQATDTSL
ncbi:MAG: hypothetical protein WBM13_06320 [Bacteroidia bacterium]